MLTFAGEHFTFEGAFPGARTRQDKPLRQGWYLCYHAPEVLANLAERWLSGRKQRFAKPS